MKHCHSLSAASGVIPILVLSACTNQAHKTTDNPHAFITDEAKVQSITTLQELDPGRLYVMDYTADYKLDELIDFGAPSVADMMKFLATELFDVVPPLDSLPYTSAGCSAYAATESGGDFLCGRNYDYCHVEKGVEVPGTAILLRTAPVDGKKSISMVDAYWLGFHKGFYNDGKTDLSMLIAAPYEILDGLNEDGFSISVLHLDGKPSIQDEPCKQTVFANILMRKMLDNASTVEQAIEIASSYNISAKTPAEGNLHYFIADATGDYAILEYSYADASSVDSTLPNIMKVFRGNDCDRYVTNFYVDPALVEHPRLGPLGKHGLWRYDTLKVNLVKNNYTLTNSQAMGLLKKVSQNSNPNENTSHTQWSALYNLSKKTLELSILQEYDNIYTFSIE